MPNGDAKEDVVPVYDYISRRRSKEFWFTDGHNLDPFRNIYNVRPKGNKCLPAAVHLFVKKRGPKEADFRDGTTVSKYFSSIYEMFRAVGRTATVLKTSKKNSFMLIARRRSLGRINNILPSF